MIVLAGGRVVLPDRVLPAGSLVIDEGRIAGIEDRVVESAAGAEIRRVTGHTLVPGFIDVHVHGVGGHDVLEGADAVARVAARLPRYGVTGFCPTSVACAPDVLQTFLAAVVAARAAAPPGAARVLPAHLESNFINPDWSGAQPRACLRSPAAGSSGTDGGFGAEDILRVIETHASGVGIVTLAPELEGGLDLVRRFRERGHRVAIGHTGATLAQARAAIAAGVTHATHLFNRMPPFTHREPGAVGAVLESDAVVAEVICDGFHVHPSAVGLAVRAKTAARVMAITDGTAVSGLPPGARGTLGGRTIVAGDRTATLADGTFAGSVITMDRAFRLLVGDASMPLEIAARLCATTPADQLGLTRLGRLEVGAEADVVVLGPALEVVETWIGGRLAGEPSSHTVRLHTP